MDLPSLRRSQLGHPAWRLLILALPLCWGAVACNDADETPADEESPASSQEAHDAASALPNEADGAATSALDAALAQDAHAASDAAPGKLDAASPTANADASADASRAAPSGGPSSCQPAFREVCKPEIIYKNDEPEGRGAMFEQVIPDPVATMQDTACTVCSILFRDPSEIPEKKRHKRITLTLRDNENVADASGNALRVDVKHIAKYKDPKKALLEFRGVLVHETAHLYQNYGNNGLGEGMADFVRIRVGLYEPGRRGPGGAWTDPYTTSGFFFSWLAGPGVYHRDGREPHDVDIGYKINKTIGESGPDGVPKLLRDTFGKDVNALWQDYQSAID